MICKEQKLILLTKAKMFYLHYVGRLNVKVNFVIHQDKRVQSVPEANCESKVSRWEQCCLRSWYEDIVLMTSLESLLPTWCSDCQGVYERQSQTKVLATDYDLQSQDPTNPFVGNLSVHINYLCYSTAPNSSYLVSNLLPNIISCFTQFFQLCKVMKSILNS